jgi:glucose-6-phosphate isomerase
LGWLDAPAAVPDLVERLQRFTNSVRADGLTDVFLLGMGGSSLCAEVFRDVPGLRAHSCRLAILDTTDERTDSGGHRVPQPGPFPVHRRQQERIDDRSDDARAPLLLRHVRTLDGKAGPHFVAITDPGTHSSSSRSTGDIATRSQSADIGGRYSALSLFGLVPAALLGLDIAALGRSAERMTWNATLIRSPIRA